jgi:RNA polymerase sigma-70 factor, ECF subfamily
MFFISRSFHCCQRGGPRFVPSGGKIANRERIVGSSVTEPETLVPPGVTVRCVAQDSGSGVHSLASEALAYVDALHNLARYLTGNEADAEDLVQETYMRALRAEHQFTRGTNLKAWLFRILRNTFVSVYRRQRHDPTVGGLDTVDANAQGAATGPWLFGDIELDRLRKLVAEEIEAALMTLPEESRTVILLDLEGLTEVEVADVVGCAVGTVKSRLARARAALRQKLKDYAR